MKLLVYSSLLLEIAQTLMVTHDTFRIFATGYGDFSGLDDIHLLWLTLPILGGVGLFLFSRCPTRDFKLGIFFGSDVVGLLCHLTFAYRITLLSDSKAIGAVIASVS